MQTKDEITIDVRELFRSILKKWWLILIGVIGGIGIGFAIANYFITPMFTSSTKVYILARQSKDTLTYSDTQLSIQLTDDYEELIKSRYVLDQVIQTLKLNTTPEALSKAITISKKEATRILTISVKDPNPEMAQKIAMETRNISAEHIKNVMDVDSVNVVDEANLPTVPSSPSVKRYSIFGGLIGLLIVLIILIIRFITDDTIKTPEDIEKQMGLITLASIPLLENEATSKKKMKGGK